MRLSEGIIVYRNYMKNKHFNKLSFRNKASTLRKPSFIDINQLEDSIPSSFICFSQASRSYMSSDKKANADVQFCLTQSLKVQPKTNRDSTCQNCKRKHHAFSTRACGRYNTSNVAKLVSPKIVQIVLDQPHSLKTSKKRESIHSMNSFSRVLANDRDFLKESHVTEIRSRESATLTRSFSSKANTNLAKKTEISDRYARQQTQEGESGISRSKTFNKIFGKNTSQDVGRKQVNWSGIFSFPVKGHSKYAKYQSPYCMPQREPRPSVAHILVVE